LNEKNLVVCDKELRYADGLGENISVHGEFALKVFICTNMESVRKLKKEREIHIFIVDESFSREERTEASAEETFVLTEDCCQDLGEGETEVYKFQSADKILSIVFETYCDRVGGSILKTIKKQKQKLIGIYSPIHRVGRTSLALALGKELSKTEKTLYLNLEEYADVGMRFARAEGRNLGDLLYYIRQGKEHAALRVSTMIMQIGDLDYIPPFSFGADLKEVTLEEWKNLLQMILEKTAYEVVVLDLGECVQGLLDILGFCHTVYMPVLEDDISMHKVRQFEGELDAMGLGELKKKIQIFPATEDVEIYARKQIREEM
jgi:hypothetical protein